MDLNSEPRVAHNAAVWRTWLDLALVGALVAVSLWRLLPAVSTTPFHRDEARWLSNSKLLREWRHPFSSRWQDEGYKNVFGTFDERNRRRSQPPLAMYVLGIGVYLQRGELPGNGYWIMSQDYAWNEARGNLPSAGELAAGRRTDVAISVLTVVAVFAMGVLLTNRIGGVSSALVYGFHPLVRDTASRAWSDPLLTLLAAVSAIAGYRFAQKPGWGKAIVLGTMLGLGGATKLSPLAVAAATGVVGLLILGWQFLRRQPWGQLTRLGIGLAVAPAIAFAVFVAVYPYVWTDPIDHTQRMFNFRTVSFELQGASFPPAKVDNRTDAFDRVGNALGTRLSVGGLLAETFGIERWESLRNLDLALAVAGWLLIAAMMVKHGVSWPPALMAGLVAVQAGVVIFGMGVEYARYLLPVVLAVAVGAGATIGTVWEIARHRAWFKTQAEETG